MKTNITEVEIPKKKEILQVEIKNKNKNYLFHFQGSIL